MTNATLQLAYKNSAWFTTNAAVVLGAGRVVFLSGTRTFKVGDGSTALSALTFYDASGGGSAAWGSITGTLSNQTDLNNALAAKYDASNVEYSEVAFSGTITWTGSAAPSGATNHRVVYSKIGKQVSAGIYLNYASAGTALTNILITDLSQLPTPAFPNGWDIASSIINRCLALAQTSQTAATTATAPVIRKNSGNTSWEIAHTAAFTSGNYRYFQVFLNYICI